MSDPTVDDGLTELLSALVAIDSVNPDLVPGSVGEAEVAGYVAGWLSARGLDVTVDEVEPGRPNVIAVARGRKGGRALMLNSHLDTVGVAGMTNPHVAVIKNGRLYGRGGGDTKGGLAAAMWVAADVQRRGGFNGDLILTAVIDEEYGSKGTEAIVGRWTADAGIVLEPSALSIRPAHKGFVWLTVTVEGVAAHGSRADLGIDAIAHMGRVLVALEELGRQLDRGPRHAMLGSGTLHASLIEGGQEVSSYPERCTLRVERRTVPGESADAVSAEVQEILDRLAGGDSNFRASLSVDFVRDSLEVSHDEPIVEALLRHGEAVLGKPPELIGLGGWTDAALLNAAGIPSVVFGPTAEGIHGVVESVDLASVAACAQVVLAVAEEICGSG